MELNYLRNALGSCMICMGGTQVLCSVSCDEKVPPFLKGTGGGWVTAEYGMLPASCNQRIPRDASRGKVNGRSQEIQRLIGRSLRAIVDFKRLGERTLWIDCDVIQGDGGTRTAAITGAFVALADAVRKLQERGALTEQPIIDTVAAVSVGIVNGKYQLDLEYAQDSIAEVDMNIVMTGSGKIVEIQGTAEKTPFEERDLTALLRLARKGIRELSKVQKAALNKGKKR